VILLLTVWSWPVNPLSAGCMIYTTWRIYFVFAHVWYIYIYVTSYLPAPLKIHTTVWCILHRQLRSNKKTNLANRKTQFVMPRHLNGQYTYFIRINFLSAWNFTVFLRISLVWLVRNKERTENTFYSQSKIFLSYIINL